jgi:hypothetical protein
MLLARRPGKELSWSRLVIIAAAAALLLGCATQAAAPTQDSVAADELAIERAVSAYFDSFLSGDVAGMREQMHPDALEEFKSMSTELLQSVDTEGEALSLFGVDSYAALGEFPAGQIFDTFMEVLVIQTGIADVFAQLGARVDIEGVLLADSGDGGFAVYRLGLSEGDARVSKLGVIEARRHADGWRLMLSGEVSGMLGSGSLF